MCVFCEIVAGDSEAHLVHSDEGTVAFLDRLPLFPGHTLIVPRAHVETLAELPPTDIGPLFETAQLLSAAVPQAMGSHGTLVLINNKVSQSVPHLHIHIVPRRFKDGLRGFLWPRHKYKSEDEMAAVAESIRNTIERQT